jgi:hypothetical protein
MRDHGHEAAAVRYALRLLTVDCAGEVLEGGRSRQHRDGGHERVSGSQWC